MRDSNSGAARRGAVAAAAAAAAGLLLAALAGCSQMDAALSKQWMVVDFSPSTSIATALHVRTACSHIQHAPPMALPAKHSVINIMYGVRFDTTNASPAELAAAADVPAEVRLRSGREPGDGGRRGQLGSARAV